MIWPRKPLCKVRILSRPTPNGNRWICVSACLQNGSWATVLMLLELSNSNLWIYHIATTESILFIMAATKTNFKTIKRADFGCRRNWNDLPLSSFSLVNPCIDQNYIVPLFLWKKKSWKKTKTTGTHSLIPSCTKYFFFAFIDIITFRHKINY